jgi:hypothetical protein
MPKEWFKVLCLVLKRSELVGYEERCTQKDHKVLGQECGYRQQADRSKKMKEVCRTANAVIRQLHVRSRLGLEATYRSPCILNLDPLTVCSSFLLPDSA